MVSIGRLHLGSYILSSMCGLLPGAAASFQLNAIGYRYHERLHLCLLGTLPVAFGNQHTAAHSLCSVTIAVRPIVQQTAAILEPIDRSYGCLYKLKADVANMVQFASQTEQDLHIAVRTDIAVDIHACSISGDDV